MMGRNRIGETTTLECIMDLLRLQSGEIRLRGEPISSEPAASRAARRIGYVPQGREVFARLSVEEHLKLGLVANPGARGRRAMDRALETFPVLKDMLRRLDLGLTLLLVEQKLPWSGGSPIGSTSSPRAARSPRGPIEALDDAVVRRHLTV